MGAMAAQLQIGNAIVLSPHILKSIMQVFFVIEQI
jgi:hypothetical protein